MSRTRNVLFQGVPISLLIVGIILGAYYLGTLKNSPSQYNNHPINTSDVTAESNIVVSPVSNSSSDSAIDTSKWKVYVNNKYGFNITYPKVGTVVDDSGTHLGECGSRISDTVTASHNSEDIYLDNFFAVHVTYWGKSITDYIKENSEDLGGPTYQTQAIAGSNSDEAIAMGPNNNDGRFSAPFLSNDIAFFKKNNTLYVLQNFQNSGNYGGCLNVNQDSLWNIPLSFKFIN